MFHVIRSGFDLTKLDQAQPTLRFDFLYVPTNLKGDAFITCVGGGAGWEIVELYEKGGGKFTKGLSFAYGSNNSKEKTLSDFGFERKVTTTPIWVVLKRV
jgi:hypothetical protein